MKPTKLLLLAFILTLILPVLAAKDSLVPPQRMEIPFETAWMTMLEAIENDGAKISSENRGQGIIRTRYKEFATGLLTQSHLEKIGMDTDVSDGSYEKVEYQYEIEIRLVAERLTIITVDANIRALHRNFLGEEKWVKIKSNGRREEFLLNSFGKILWGEDWEMEYTKKRRGKRHYALPSDLSERVASPERP